VIYGPEQKQTEAVPIWGRKTSPSGVFLVSVGL